MLHTLMLLSLGFLIASLIAFLLAPFFWRYAVHVTKQHIRQTSPLTMGEIRADRDQLRAEHALHTRKLEIERDKFNAQTKDLKIEVADLKKQIREKTQDASAYDAEVKTKDEQITQISAERDRLKVMLNAREQDLKKSQSETRKEKNISSRASTALKAAGEEVRTHEAREKTLKKSAERAEKQHQAATQKLKKLEGHISRLDACTSAVKNLNSDLLDYYKECDKFLNSSYKTKKEFQAAQKKLLKTHSGLISLEKSVRKQWSIASRAEPGGRTIFAPLKAQIDHAKSAAAVMKKIAEKATFTSNEALQHQKAPATKPKSPQKSQGDLSNRIRSLQDKLDA